MKAALISLGSKSSKWTIDAMRKYFDIVDDINLKDIEVNLGVGKLDVLYNGQPLPKYDGIYAKGSFRYAPLLRSITRALSEHTYMPIKAETFTIGHDKLLTHLALQLYKTPMPTTYLASSPEGAKKILERVNYPLIMKFPQGTQGKGVMYADSFASASSMLDALSALRQPFLIQEYIETGGVDIRAIVVGGKIVASMKRKAVSGEERANIHAGGKGEACVLDSHARKIAIDAAQSIGAAVCAVDILEGPKGPLVIEVNVSPGLQGITAATNVNVADKIAKFLYERTKEKSESGKKLTASKILEEVSRKPSEMIEEIITTLDFRGERILLPKLVTNLTKFDDKQEVTIKARKGRVIICGS